MYIIDGIAYAGDENISVKVRAVRPLDGHKLFILFNNSEKRIFNFKPYLDFPCYKELKDESLFKKVYVENGTAVWNDGKIDIAPETLFEDGDPVSEF